MEFDVRVVQQLAALAVCVIGLGLSFYGMKLRPNRAWSISIFSGVLLINAIYYVIVLFVPISVGHLLSPARSLATLVAITSFQYCKNKITIKKLKLAEGCNHKETCRLHASGCCPCEYIEGD